MIVTTLWQPFGPDGGYASLGTSALAELLSGSYRRVRVCVAYATSSGTSRIFGHLRDFIAAGGAAEIFVGVRNGITTSQAVSHLLSAGAVVHACDTMHSVVFHPKVYLLDGEDAAWLAVGSSNLTREGMFRNYETSTIIRLDLANAADSAYLKSFDAWFTSIPRSLEECFTLSSADLATMLADHVLIDESVRPPIERAVALPARRRGRRRGAPVIIPPAPPPHPDAAVVERQRRGRRRGRGGRRTPQPRAGTARYFAMTLSAFDCSHRRATPGTPEVSLPEPVTPFFPAVRRQGRAYRDAYFDVLLNNPAGNSQVVSYRIWQRPPGTRSGHADWRINVKHDTIDLTNAAGNDIVLFEKLPSGSEPPYEVWIVHPGDPTYVGLLARCNREVQAAGTAGRKRHGLF